MTESLRAFDEFRADPGRRLDVSDRASRCHHAEQDRVLLAKSARAGFPRPCLAGI
jgi:hypothetical protein